MSIDQDRERLAQKPNLDWITRDPKATGMVTVVPMRTWVALGRTLFHSWSALIPARSG